MIAMRTRAELRRSWRELVVLAVLLGVFGGGALAALAGARRTATAVERFRVASGIQDGGIDADRSQWPAIAALPEVASIVHGGYVLGMVLDANDRPIGHVYNPLAGFGDDPAGGRPILVAGRFPDARNPHEIMVDETSARKLHVRPGSRIRFGLATPDQAEAFLQDLGNNPEVLRGPHMSLRVVGVMRQLSDLLIDQSLADVEYASADDLLLTTAFLDAYRGKGAMFEGIAYRLKHREDLARFQADVTKITGNPDAIHLGSDNDTAAFQASKTAHVLAIALVIFGGFLAITTLIIVGQSLGRAISASSEEGRTLGALGATPLQISAVQIVRILPATLGGAALAALGAVGLSPLFPIGVARRAEISPGFHLDAFVVGAGAAALVLLLELRCLYPAVRAARLRPHAMSADHPSRICEALASTGAPVGVVAGARLALQRARGSGSVPVAGAIAGCTTALVALLATLVFGSSLSTLVVTPTRWGWNWDVMVGNPHGGDLTADAKARLGIVSDVAAFTGTAFTDSLLVGRRPTDILLMRDVKGTIPPGIVHGRVPHGPDEIALGPALLRGLGKDIGAEVDVGPNAEQHTRMRIVGEVLIPPAVMNDQADLGGGALATTEGLRRFLEELPPFNVFLARFAPGADHARTVATIKKLFPGSTVTGQAPQEVRNIEAARSVPLAMSFVLMLLAIATIAHATLVTVSRRRQDLAILKTLGFVRRQIRSTIAWQATLIMTLAAALAVPTGIALGRWAWLAYIRTTGIPSPPSVGVLSVAAVALAGIMIANLSARLPGRRAARTSAASVLRAE